MQSRALPSPFQFSDNVLNFTTQSPFLFIFRYFSATFQFFSAAFPLLFHGFSAIFLLLFHYFSNTN